jgi:hypothetical protein
VWVAVDVKNFYAYNMQVHTGKTDGARKKRQGLCVIECVVCHMYGTRRGVTADNFFKSCKLGNFLLSKNMTLGP